MKTLVLVFHPDLKGQSRVNAALAKAAEELPNVSGYPLDVRLCGFARMAHTVLSEIRSLRTRP